MKTGILTFHASHNYGSMLQAYALMRTIRELGHDARVINFRSREQRCLIMPELEVSHPRSSLSRLVRHPLQTVRKQRKYDRFESFLRNELQAGKELPNKEAVENYLTRDAFEAVVVGSDQVWNPGCYDFSDVYTAAFTKPGLRRVAYAPSLGSNPEACDKRIIEELLSNVSKFDSLSSREERGARFLGGRLGRDVKTVLDPTLLQGRGLYDRLAVGHPDFKEPYIFYYTPREEPDTFSAALRISKMTGMRILVSESHADYEGADIIRVEDCGPKEFLRLVRNAALCVGKSFHLLAFSIIFHREFILISKESDSRFDNLLATLGLKGRVVDPLGPIAALPGPICWDEVDRRLSVIRQESLDYLKTSLSTK